jgi:hypothetical protein
MQEVIKEEFVFHCTNPETGQSFESVCDVNCNMHSELFFLTQINEVQVRRRRTRVVTEVLREIDVSDQYPNCLTMWKDEREAFYGRANKEESFSDVVRALRAKKTSELDPVPQSLRYIEMCDGQ